LPHSALPLSARRCGQSPRLDFHGAISATGGPCRRDPTADRISWRSSRSSADSGVQTLRTNRASAHRTSRTVPGRLAAAASSRRDEFRLAPAPASL
jgi:hypothetical protein